MARKVILLTTWFPLAMCLLIANVYTLLSFASSKTQQTEESVLVATDTTDRITMPEQSARVLGSSITVGDARPKLLTTFLQEHASPLTPYSDLIVQKADEYAIDYRIVVAIAMCESNVGKRIPSSKSYNAWGISVYTGQTSGAEFRDWPHAIDWVSRYIKTKYYDKGITDLKKIGAIWAPPSVETGYSWTNCVKLFQDGIQ